MLKLEFELEFEFGFELELEFELQFDFTRTMNVEETQFWCPRDSVLVSERVILGHFRGLGKGYLSEFGLLEPGPDLRYSRPKSSYSSRELLANSKA